MALVLDIVLAGVFVALVIAAAKKGFVLTVLEVVAIVAALFCASYVSKPVAQTSYDLFLKNNIIKAINSEVDDKTVSNNINEVAFNAIPEYALDFAECAGLNVNSIKSDINNSISNAVSSGKFDEIGEKIEEKCIRPVAVAAIGIIMFLIMFVIFILIFRLLAKVISTAVKLPIVGSLDKILGGLLGAARGLIILVFVSTVLVTMLSNGDSELALAIKESKVIGFVESFNPFVDKLQSLFK